MPVYPWVRFEFFRRVWVVINLKWLAGLSDAMVRVRWFLIGGRA